MNLHTAFGCNHSEKPGKGGHPQNGLEAPAFSHKDYPQVKNTKQNRGMQTNREWALYQFGSIWFGGPKVTRRVVSITEWMARGSGDMQTKQMQTWADKKSSYRFMEDQAVSHDALCKP